MAVWAAGSEPRFHILEESRENQRLRRENQRIRRDNQQLKRKILQLQKKGEGNEGSKAKKRRANGGMEDSTSGYLELRFTDPLPDIIYTMDKVKAENTKVLRVELIDTRTGKVVTAVPSMTVQLVVLPGDLKEAETGNFSSKCFEKNILTRKKDNGPLLILGDNLLNLNEGTAAVGNFKITANSSWIPSGCFRLGAKVTNGDFKGMRVKEAITNTFVVKENRGKWTAKRYTPRPDDPVWRLEGIAKSGITNQRLTEKGINTVGDFLKSLNENESTLRDIAGMRSDLWEKAADNARRCILSDQRILRPLSNQLSNRVYDVAQPKKVGKPPSLQAENETHVVGDSSAIEPIDSIPGGSSKPGIQQQISSQDIAGISDMSGKKVDFARAPGDALENFPSGVTWNPEVNSQAITVNLFSNAFPKMDGIGLWKSDMGGINEFASTFGVASENPGWDATFSPQVQSPATHVNRFYSYSQFQEKDSLESEFEDIETLMPFSDPSPQRKEDLCNITKNSIDAQGRVNVSSVPDFPNISESAHKDECAPKHFR